MRDPISEIFERGVNAGREQILKELAKVPHDMSPAAPLKLARAAYQKIYKEHWKDIVERRGKLSKTAVMKELHDYAFLLDAVPRVYDSLSFGRLSKPNILPEVVIAEIEDVQNETIKDREAELKDELKKEVAAVAKEAESIRIAALMEIIDGSFS